MRNRICCSLSVVCSLLGIWAGSASAQSPFTFSNPPGRYAVGLRVVLQYDHSRTYRSAVDLAGRPYTGERARPIQTLIWYPAAKSNTSHVTYGDYLSLYATEENFSPSPAQAATTLKSVPVMGWEWLPIDVDKTAQMWAVKDAVPEPGKYPVVIHAPGSTGPAFENADVCEFLASHGYVVIASPDMGTDGRYMPTSLEGIETQARDISFLIGYAASLPQADTSQIAVVGYSWGGISNLFAAAKDNRISALVSFDGSARSRTDLIRDAKYVQPELMTLPVLFFTRQEVSYEELDQSGRDVSHNVLNQMVHSDVTIVRMHAMSHYHFGSIFLRSAWGWDIEPANDYSPAEVVESYGWVATYTLKFLEGHFRGDAAALAFLTNAPAKNGVHPHLMTVDHRPARGTPMTFDTFRVEVASKGFEKIEQVYADTRSKHPDFTLTQDEVKQWGYGLLFQYPIEGLHVVRLNAALHPESSSAHWDLAMGYQVNGQPALAIASMKKALELDPSDEDAKALLRKWQK